MLLKPMRYAFYVAPVVLMILGCQTPGLTVSAIDSARIRPAPAKQVSVAATLRAKRHALDESDAKSRIPVASRPIIIRTSGETSGDRSATVNTASQSSGSATEAGGTRTAPGPLPSITEKAERLRDPSATANDPAAGPLGSAFDDNLLLDAFPDQSEADADAAKFRSKSGKQSPETKAPPSRDTLEETITTEEKRAPAATPPPAIDATEDEETLPSLIWAEKPKAAPTTAGRLAKRETGKRIVEAIAKKLHAAELNDYDLTIEFRNGVATLKGQITYPEQKLAATYLTALVPGVKRVDNQLEPVRESVLQQSDGPTIEIDPSPTNAEDPITPKKQSAFDLTNLLPDRAENDSDASPKADSPPSAPDATNDTAKTAADEKRPLDDFPRLDVDVNPSPSPAIAAKPDNVGSDEEQTADAATDAVQTADTDANTPSAETADDLLSPFPDLSEEEADSPAKKAVANVKVETPKRQPTVTNKSVSRVLPTAASEDELLGLFPDMSEDEADQRLRFADRDRRKLPPQPRVQISLPTLPKQQPKQQPQRIRPQTPPPTDDLLDAFPDGSEEEADRLKGLR